MKGKSIHEISGDKKLSIYLILASFHFNRFKFRRLYYCFRWNLFINFWFMYFSSNSSVLNILRVLIVIAVIFYNGTIQCPLNISRHSDTSLVHSYLFPMSLPEKSLHWEQNKIEFPFHIVTRTDIYLNWHKNSDNVQQVRTEKWEKQSDLTWNSSMPTMLLLTYISNWFGHKKRRNFIGEKDFYFHVAIRKQRGALNPTQTFFYVKSINLSELCEREHKISPEIW